MSVEAKMMHNLGQGNRKLYYGVISEGGVSS